MGADLDPERAQEGLRQPAGGHARGGLAGGGALEHVAHVRVAELLDPGEVGVPGRGRWTSSTSASTGHGFIRSSQFW